MDNIGQYKVALNEAQERIDALRMQLTEQSARHAAGKRSRFSWSSFLIGVITCVIIFVVSRQFVSGA